jgi:hypothetical protein
MTLIVLSFFLQQLSTSPVYSRMSCDSWDSLASILSKSSESARRMCMDLAVQACPKEDIMKRARYYRMLIMYTLAEQHKLTVYADVYKWVRL